MKKEKNSVLLLIISFISAVVIWVVVMNYAKPIIDDFVNIPIQIQVEDNKGMDQLGHIYTLSDDNSVRVNYKVRSDVANNIKGDKFKAYVLISNATNFSDDLQVHVEYLDPSIEKYISSVNIFPQLVHVKVDDMESKYLNIQTNYKGTLSGDSTVGSVILSPTGINVSGIKEELDRINSAKIDINLDSHNDIFSDTAMVKFYDADGKEIKFKNHVATSADKINYTVIVYNKKAIVLNPVITGVVMNGCKLDSIEVIPSVITISGPRSYLDKIVTIDLPEVDITGVSESKVIDSFIPGSILPSGISYVGSEEKIDVKVNVSGSAKIIIAPKQKVE